MKIKVTIKETVWRELTVNTDDFNLNAKTPNEEVFEMAELINEIRNEPEKLFEQFETEVEETREITKTDIKPVEE